MKRWNIASLVVIVVGIILVIFSVGHHGAKALTWNAGGFQVDKRERTVVHPGDYDKLVVNTKLPVTVKPGNVNQITIQQQSLNRKKHPVTAKVANHTLTVAGGDNRQNSFRIHGLSVGWDDEAYDSNGKITIVVPKTTTVKTVTLQRNWIVRLENLTVKNVTGSHGGSFQAKNVTFTQPLDLSRGDADIFLTNVTTPRVTAKTGDGDITIKQSHFKQANNVFHTADGDVSVKNTHLGSADVTSNDGDLHIGHNQVTQRVKAHTDDGDAYGIVSDTAGVSVQTNDGDIQLMGRSRKSGTHLRPNAKVQYAFSTDDGDITVR
ncbi:DUF4097 family beta strand repeat-containing protein [Levilactobacillus acidifarinae]|uniref:DUF4097 domain-containing protein n=1 Tax=Levilactobacillus acidifarinae DSM 19394 = JCM 15949 TaxID=1423715 RepID=A0A0R1LKM6_9LACO|nr:DUF4097 family beta strand repeat-containing protein [Levilactobacillus acidifarinae]KRK96120.1 hypothetical protein FD25_GL002584 [Levilactobacillus acidifarinae DSM 19394]GEO69483.1 hypothetical protein LAC03_13930 [Levilactobacillus acidifarinae]